MGKHQEVSAAAVAVQRVWLIGGQYLLAAASARAAVAAERESKTGGLSPRYGELEAAYLDLAGALGRMDDALWAALYGTARPARAQDVLPGLEADQW